MGSNFSTIRHIEYSFGLPIKIEFLALQSHSRCLFAFVHNWHTVIYNKLHILINQTFWHYGNMHFN